jgi:hypothetical protein
MVRIFRILAATVAVVGLVAAGGPVFDGAVFVDQAFAQAKGKPDKPGKAKHHTHKNGKDMLGEKIKQNGEHHIDKVGKHDVAVKVSNGKIAGLHVKHAEKGDVPVTKYKTKKKMAANDTGFRYAAYMPVQYQDLGVTYIGYSFIDDFGEEQIYWFPYEMILDGDTGAIDYVPLS